MTEHRICTMYTGVTALLCSGIIILLLIVRLLIVNKQVKLSGDLGALFASEENDLVFQLIFAAMDYLCSSTPGLS